jgi:hypothetical protein
VPRSDVMVRNALRIENAFHHGGQACLAVTRWLEWRDG